MDKPQTTNKYFDNEVTDRLCEASIEASCWGVNLRLNGLGVEVEKNGVCHTVGYLDISEAKVNVLLFMVKKVAGNEV